VTYGGLGLAELSAMTVDRSLAFFGRDDGGGPPDARTLAVTEAVRDEIVRRLGLVRDVGLGYLRLDRASGSLSGGEAQRLRLAGLLGVRLTGVTFVLDEPTLGLHSRDTGKLIELVRGLAAEGNTVVAVEHDLDVIRAADHVLDLGPGAGRDGGRIVAEGPPAAVERDPGSVTGPYLAGRAVRPGALSGSPGPGIAIEGARAHNLRGFDVTIPSGILTAVTGVSGSGKTSLVFDVLGTSAAAGRPVACNALRGLDRFDRVVAAGIEAPAKSASSVPLTYLGLFDAVRGLYAGSDQARARGLKKAHFSFLTPEGRCEACGGTGRTSVSLDHLADVSTPCETCRGARYAPRSLQVRVAGRTIAEALDLTAAEGAAAFAGLPKVSAGLSLLAEIGLDYLRLGQPLDTLSGGERQRLKLAAELSGPPAGRVLYLFDEPTTGLHPQDVDRLLGLFDRLLAAGHTLVAVEHDLDLVSRAGCVVDLGPDGGDRGGGLIVQGTPEAVMACPASFTGAALRARAGRLPIPRP
jgi:excinuclease ABC subunit A